MASSCLFRVIGLALAVSLGCVPMAVAQHTPAEPPPPGFGGAQHVDSRGCAFVRVRVDGTVVWAPRLAPDRVTQVCGLAPTTLPRETATTAAIPPEAVPAAAQVRVALPVQATAAPVAARPVATIPRPVATMPRAAHAGRCTHPHRSEAIRCSSHGRFPHDAPGISIATPAEAVRARRPAAVREVVRYAVDPPPGYRAAWDDGRMNPYRGLGTAAGHRQMEQVWTNTSPQREPGTVPRGYRAIFAPVSRPSVLVPARVQVRQP